MHPLTHAAIPALKKGVTRLRFTLGQLTRRIALLIATVVVAFGAATLMSTTAASAAPGTGSVTHAATCAYHVRYNWTPVQENPDTNSVIRKYKFAGNPVTGPCWAVYDTEGGTWFTAVYCSCATDGIGWIRSYWLY